MDQLAMALTRALRHRELREEVKRLRATALASKPVREFIGESHAMQELYALIQRVAEADASVIVRGETGTGKELVAAAIHARSRRASGPLVSINCAAVPEALLEGELFGHLRGAYTDARSDRKGLLLEASGGTLFLDEIAEMTMSMQAKLLRALEVRRVRPLGGTTETPFDVRLVAATNRDLPSLIEEGRFREDLYYRINVVEVELPPLRARGADVLLLAQHFLTTFAGGRPVRSLSPAVAERLMTYAWPGNVRELRNCMERAAALAQHEAVIVEDLPAHIRNYASSHILVAAQDPSELVSLAEVERRYIERVLQAVGGNKRHAARILGLDRATLYRKLERYGTPPS
jgi:two-component system response regulator HydG